MTQKKGPDAGNHSTDPGFSGVRGDAFRRPPAAVRDAPAATPSLFVIRGARLGTCLAPGSEPLIIGRAADVDCQFDDGELSRRHCRLVCDGEALWIEDLGSTNGTLVNGTLVERTRLFDGDHVRIGQTLLKCVSDGSDEARYHLAMYRGLVRDELTGLYNRRYALDALAQQIAQARHDPAHLFSAVMLDIDHFKNVNDRYGHATGDHVLREVARVLGYSIRASDTLARVGGEEFLVLLPGVGLADALRIADDLRAAVERDCVAINVPPCAGARPPIGAVTLSAGVGTWRAQLRDGDALLRAADDKLYEAKAAGRNRVLG